MDAKLTILMGSSVERLKGMKVNDTRELLFYVKSAGIPTDLEHFLKKSSDYHELKKRFVLVKVTNTLYSFTFETIDPIECHMYVTYNPMEDRNPGYIICYYTTKTPSY